MNLNIVDIFQLDMMVRRDRERVSGNMGKRGRMFEKPAETAGRENDYLALYYIGFSFAIQSDDPPADMIVFNNINHSGILGDGDVIFFAKTRQQFCRYFLSGYIIMMKNSGL